MTTCKTLLKVKVGQDKYLLDLAFSASIFQKKHTEGPVLDSSVRSAPEQYIYMHATGYKEQCIEYKEEFMYYFLL